MRTSVPVQTDVAYMRPSMSVVDAIGSQPFGSVHMPYALHLQVALHVRVRTSPTVAQEAAVVSVVSGSHSPMPLHTPVFHVQVIGSQVSFSMPHMPQSVART